MQLACVRRVARDLQATVPGFVLRLLALHYLAGESLHFGFR